MTRSERIREFRQKQPIAELERKWNKAKGRWSNQFWAAEWLDLSSARAAELNRGIKWDRHGTNDKPPNT